MILTLSQELLREYARTNNGLFQDASRAIADMQARIAQLEARVDELSERSIRLERVEARIRGLLE